MRSRKAINNLLWVFILIGIVAAMYVGINSHRLNDGFQFLWLWPIVYTISLIILFSTTIIRREHSIAILFTFLFRYFMRFIAYPIATVTVGHNYIPIARFVSLSESDIVRAILLCVIEIIVVTLFVVLLENKTKSDYGSNDVENNAGERQLSLYGNKTVYYFIFLAAIIILVFYGIPHKLISFFKVEEVVFEWSNLDTLIKYFIIMSLAIAVMMVFDSQYRSKKSSFRKLFICLFIAVLFTGVIQGGSRAFQSYVALILISILIQVFPNHKMIIWIAISSAFVFVLLILTFDREGPGTNSRWFGGINSLAGMLQIYFGGPTSIANSIKVFESSQQVNIFNLIYDYIDVFPLSLIVGGLGYTTSELYNLAIYSGTSISGHIVFAPSYSYIYFGYIGIGITMILNVTISCYFNKLFYKTKYYETKYLFGFCLFRCCSGLLTHPPQYMSGVFQYLFIMGFILMVSNTFKNRGRIILWKK